MRTPCGNCGTYVELGTALREGREVLCPSCGAVIVPGRPSRQEIPGLGRTGNVVPQCRSNSSEGAGSVSAKLGKPEAQGSSEAVERTVDLRVKEHEAMKRRRWLRGFAQKIFDVAVLLSLLLVLWFIGKAWSDYRQHLRTLEADRQAAENKRVMERERLKAEERARAEERLAAERDAMRKAKEREAEARAAKEAERKMTEETYKLFLYALCENEFDMFSAAVTSDWMTVETELCYLLPIESRNPKLYWVTTRTNEAARIVKIDASGARDEIELPLFLKRLAGLDYLIARDGKVYYHASRRKPLSGKLNWKTPTDPATLFFGGLQKTLDTLDPTYDELCFDLIFIPKDGSKRIFCENVPFGCVSSPEAVRQAVAEAYPPPASIPFKYTAPPKFKRTVKAWGGSIMKLGLDNVTYVPRSPPRCHVSYSNLSLPGCRTIYRRRVQNLSTQNWSALLARAQQEDIAEAAYYERWHREEQERHRKQETAAERAWREKLDKILREGQLYYRARKAKSR